MDSRPILITGPLASGKTFIAESIAGMITNFDTEVVRTEFKKFRIRPADTSKRLVIVEGIPTAEALEDTKKVMDIIYPAAKLICTSQFHITAKKQFRHIKLQNHLNTAAV